MVNTFDILQNILSQNRSFLGLSTIMINLGSRYIASDLTPTQHYILSSSIVKIFIFFCMAFLATRDFKTSFVLTFSFYLAIYALLNENSQFNIIPKFVLQKIQNEMDINQKNQKQKLNQNVFVEQEQEKQEKEKALTVLK